MQRIHYMNMHNDIIKCSLSPIFIIVVVIITIILTLEQYIQGIKKLKGKNKTILLCPLYDCNI